MSRATYAGEECLSGVFTSLVTQLLWLSCYEDLYRVEGIEDTNHLILNLLITYTS